MRITTGKLALALKALNPAITRDMVNRAVKSGLIVSDRNPGVENGWYYLDAYSVKAFILREFGDCEPEAVSECLRGLGL